MDIETRAALLAISNALDEVLEKVDRLQANVDVVVGNQQRIGQYLRENLNR